MTGAGGLTVTGPRLPIKTGDSKSSLNGEFLAYLRQLIRICCLGRNRYIFEKRALMNVASFEQLSQLKVGHYQVKRPPGKWMNPIPSRSHTLLLLLNPLNWHPNPENIDRDQATAVCRIRHVRISGSDCSQPCYRQRPAAVVE